MPVYGCGYHDSQGIKLAENGAIIAFIGDSTFSTQVSRIINAVYQNTDITIAVLDNYHCNDGRPASSGDRKDSNGHAAKPWI